MHKAKFIVRRDSQDEFTAAIVTANVTCHSLTDAHNFLPLLRKAVKSWVQETKGGDDLWAESSEDLNIGDLAGHGIAGPLANRLAALGIHNMDIETVSEPSVSHGWHYDTILG